MSALSIFSTAWLSNLASVFGKTLYQRKKLASNFTTTGVVTGLTFNNLVVGETYSLFYHLKENTSGVGAFACTVYNGATILTTFNAQSVPSNFTWSINAGKFVAVSTTVTIDITTNTRQIAGDGTNSSSYAELTKHTNTELTSLWT
jgi:hypothetical protein